MDILNLFMAPILGVFSGLIGTYVMLKLTMSDEKITDKLDAVLSNLTEDTEMQKKVYVLGGILGKGVRDGVGIDRLMPKKKGGLEGLIFDLLGSYLGGRIGNRQQGQEMDVIPPQRRNPEFG